MIVSYKNNFIFIKTKKTAGSSLESVLACYCGDDDIVTPLGDQEEIERHRDFPEGYPRNFVADKGIEERYREAVRSGDRKAVRKTMRDEFRVSGDAGLPRHAGARRVKEIVDEEFWNSAYKFSIERHPYEKAVSLAWWECRHGDFDTVLASVLRGDRYRNYDLYTLGGTLAVDFVIRFEKMAEDIPKVEQALGGIAVLSRLPRSNAGKRPDKRPAREVLTDAQKAIVQDTCREEFEMFGYDK